MMRGLLVIALCHIGALTTVDSYAASFAAGAAPQGAANVVASKIIKYNFPNCRRVTSASRLPDGTVSATCDGINYRVFTVYDGKAGKVVEVAMNCVAAKQLGVDCY